MIRPVVTYACETWTLKKKDIQRLLIFERKILRKKIWSEKCVEATWIIRSNDELNKIIIKNKNIVNYIRSAKTSLVRMSEDRIVKKLFQWKPLTTRCQGRPKIRWEDDRIVGLYLKENKYRKKGKREFAVTDRHLLLSAPSVERLSKRSFGKLLASKNTNFKLYQTMIRPVVTYACETWTLKKKDIQRLLIFERKILRKKIWSEKCVEATWIIRSNDELNKIIIKNKNIVNYIRSAKTSLVRMSEDRIVKKLFQWKPLTTRCQGRPKIRWEDDRIVGLYLKENKYRKKGKVNR
ncbi:hypothetical protein C0J52_02940 [Blattella germanica]|nr:hypothetical protein C0J52_02940 [Blattella germanica]